MTPNDRARFRALVKERAQGQPVAYLVGRREFFSISFAVNRHVLIPRPETEVLVSTVLGIVPEEAAARILDIGTGSGAIAISVALHRGNTTIIAIDPSREALDVARGNADRLEVLTRVDFREGDLFAPLEANERFDVIVSNPPYVPTGDIATLERDVRDFEPHSALDGGADGLHFIRRLIVEAPARLKDDGWLAIEFGIDQHEPIRELLCATNHYQDLRFIADVARRPRVVVARLRSTPS